jgi:hypothetical protein
MSRFGSLSVPAWSGLLARSRLFFPPFALSSSHYSEREFLFGTKSLKSERRRRKWKTLKEVRVNGVGTQWPLVMVRTEDGLRVYSPANPAKPYMVSATRGIPSVAVLNFPRRRQPNTARISAQYSIRLGGQSGAPAEDSYAREERLAIQNEGRAAPDRGQQRCCSSGASVRMEGSTPSRSSSRDQPKTSASARLVFSNPFSSLFAMVVSSRENCIPQFQVKRVPRLSRVARKYHSSNLLRPWVSTCQLCLS